MFCSKPVAANLAGPQTLAASPRLAHLGPRLPHCKTDRPPATILPCPPGSASSACLCSHPTHLHSTYQSIDFPYSLHTPLFPFSPVVLLSVSYPLHYITFTLHWSVSPLQDASRRKITPRRLDDTAQPPSLFVASNPLSAFTCPAVFPSLDPSSPSILTTSTHPYITATGLHPPLPLVPAPTTLLPLVADRQLFVPIKRSLGLLTNSTRSIHHECMCGFLLSLALPTNFSPPSYPIPEILLLDNIAIVIGLTC